VGKPETEMGRLNGMLGEIKSTCMDAIQILHEVDSDESAGTATACLGRTAGKFFSQFLWAGIHPRANRSQRSSLPTGWFREIETTVFDPASVFLSTH